MLLEFQINEFKKSGISNKYYLITPAKKKQYKFLATKNML